MADHESADATPISDPYPWPSVDADTTMLLVGDNNLQNRTDPPSAYRNVSATLAEADLLYGNLEGCLHRPGDNDIPDKDRWQHSDERRVNALTAAGFDAVDGANNVNYGAEAVINTVAVLEEAGIAHCGLGADLTAARAPAVVSHRGTTFGFLQWTARYYGEEPVATESSAGVAAFDPDEGESVLTDIAADVAALASEADVTVFSHHIRRNDPEIELYQRELAHRVIDAGADLVFGHGAHLNQGVELYDGRPILHCIGQFTFDWPKTRHKRDGLVARVHVTDGDIARLALVPVYRDGNNDVYLAGPDTPEGSRQLRAVADLSPDPVLFDVEGPEAVFDLPE